MFPAQPLFMPTTEQAVNSSIEALSVGKIYFNDTFLSMKESSAFISVGVE